MIGTVAVPLSGSNLREIVPHEVSHAVIHHLQGVSARDDEAAASAIGLFARPFFQDRGARRLSGDPMSKSEDVAVVALIRIKAVLRAPSGTGQFS